ncbi:MAG: GNAT family N-acetyltransferase [Salibacteraceae bacterium]
MVIRNILPAEHHALLATFNQAFSDYTVPVQMDREAFMRKLTMEGINWNLTVGTFQGNEMVGFILQSSSIVDGIPMAYNSGTGVLPQHRGKGLTLAMYEKVRQYQLEAGIRQEVLEVITSNAPAIRVYEKMQFQRVRVVTFYRQLATLPHVEIPWSVAFDQVLDSEQKQALWTIEPTWQMQMVGLERVRETCLEMSVSQDGQLIGYALLNPTTGRVWHIAVDKAHRRKGIASALIQNAQQHSEKPLNFLNVDQQAHDLTGFLKHHGFRAELSQYELLYQYP